MTPEGRVKRMVKKALDQFGADCWRFMPVQTGFGVPALDYLLSVRGRFVAIETKAPGKKLTPIQESTKAAIEAAGGLVFVVWDETSLSLAMKIMLALEFAPNGRTEIRDCLEITFPGDARRGVVSVPHKKAQGSYAEYLRDKLQDQASNPPAGGDHGAPRSASKR